VTREATQRSRGRHPTRRREEDPVDGPEPGSAHGPLQHPELAAEDEDLAVRGAVVMARLSSADEDPNEGTDEQVTRDHISRAYWAARSRIGVSDPNDHPLVGDVTLALAMLDLPADTGRRCSPTPPSPAHHRSMRRANLPDGEIGGPRVSADPVRSEL
jgi:hypothetical protein